METFDFPYHTVRTTYPQTGTSMELGRGYQFTAPPPGPYQRVFTLSFPALKYYTDENDQAVSNIEPKTNMLRFIEFYHEHLLHKSFLYNHPVWGEVEVKFARPFDEPAPIPGGDGATNSFEIALIEQP